MTDKPQPLIRNKSNGKVKGLEVRERVIPKSPTTNISSVAKSKAKNDTTAFENQQKNIKVSAVRKRQIDTLGEVIGTKFAYETIGELIDNYIATRLTPDQQRAFQALSSLNTLQ
ncbi:hypothetical protein ACA590_16445 [Lactiplantibacillus plantarum]|uniref:Uncharacterized protein n=1 Tax=Lactiplantibacillus paraplantarum TaxID=60520 RepID=A0A4Q9XXG5_9LACO|nr:MULTISPECIES: hypothetical protein [Lactiplantibacillus]MBU7446373.1 hypothetical protein [Lactiplantibacillus plantarum]MBU7459473.1 hypothetical protein [Lactiplantibacillus plantarum]MBU7462748.1 hypothetical protein [Lactiplantibacillus pentosus]MBU7482226.1 hypothetical protein [Lactiplantibacillus pentosus]MCC9316103.1 hypothetical protein [Lactiplantibacillus plantarum]